MHAYTTHGYNVANCEYKSPDQSGCGIIVTYTHSDHSLLLCDTCTFYAAIILPYVAQCQPSLTVAEQQHIAEAVAVFIRNNF